MTIARRLVDAKPRVEPCAAATQWLGRRCSVQQAWAECDNASWMVWLVVVCSRRGHGVSNKRCVSIALGAANVVSHHVRNCQDLAMVDAAVRAWLNDAPADGLARAEAAARCALHAQSLAVHAHAELALLYVVRAARCTSPDALFLDVFWAVDAAWHAASAGEKRVLVQLVREAVPADEVAAMFEAAF